MSVITLPAPSAPAQAPPEPRPARAASAFDRYFACLSELTAGPASWNRASVAALCSLLLLWAARIYTTWATWGYLPVDTGREMYVPAMLAQGKMLYRDVWFGYGPLAPYWNALLFRTFGIHLNVLYWAGSLAALGCAVLLFLSGKRLGSVLAGWAAGAILLMEAFHAWHFSFPLAYSFSAVYGCLTACLFLWLAIHAAQSTSPLWMLSAATAAAVALLIKLEYGAACYCACALLTAARAWRQRSGKSWVIDLAFCLPGVLACAAVAWWMLSIGGFEFITQENLASTWPGSFFMKNYGRAWMETTGLAINGSALLKSLGRTLFLAGVVFEAYWLFWRKRFSPRSVLLCAALFTALLGYAALALEGKVLETATAIFFPQDMVLYVAIAAALVCWRIARQDESGALVPLAVLLAFAALVAVRTLLRTMATGYSIYYNGPAVLAFLILLRPLAPRAGRTRCSVLRAELLLCIAPLAVVSVYAARFAADYNDRELLVTERGSILAYTQTTEQYRAAIEFMKDEAAAGRMVLSVPEDTSLYFLSGTQAPTRLYFFAPGMLVPGKMTEETIREIEQKPVRYVLWSNRRFPEYGVPEFGKDFNQTFVSYLTSHYRRVGLLVPGSAVEWHVRFTLWERKPDVAQQVARTN
jgi:hypothetical protein